MDGKKPWSYLTHLLYGRMRSQRHSLKFKNFNTDNKDDSQNTSSNNSSQSEENDIRQQRASKMNAAEHDASLRSL